MPKDAKGHGSNPRGKAKVSVTRPVGYTIHDIGPGGKKTLAASGVMTQGAGGQIVHAKDSTAQDRVAADTLASGPKSAPTLIHDAMMQKFVSDMKAAHATGEKFKSRDEIDPSSGRLIRRHRK